MAYIKDIQAGKEFSEYILTPYGKVLVSDLRKALNQSGVLFGGGQESKLAAKIRYDIVATDDSIFFRLYMPDYGEFVDKGRRAGPVSEKGRKSIGDWAKRKGLVSKFQASELQQRKDKQKQPAKREIKRLEFDKAVNVLSYLIARKIKRKGYRGNHFLTRTLLDGRNDKLEKHLVDFFGKQINIDFE